MRLVFATLMFALACAPAPRPLPSPIVLTPYGSFVMINGDADQRLAIQRAWVRDSSAQWALELGRLKIDPSWRAYTLALNDTTGF